MRQGRNSTEEIHAAFQHALGMGDFTAGELTKGAGVTASVAARYVRSWVSTGIAEIARTEGRTRRYRITQFARESIGAGVERDRLLETSEPVTEQLWRSMRMQKEFSAADLASTSLGVTEAQAQGYCSLLLEGGYLRVTRTAIPGKRTARYRLIKPTGAHAPVECRVRAIWDANEEEFTHIVRGRR